jgi:hypothetical protein
MRHHPTGFKTAVVGSKKQERATIEWLWARFVRKAHRKSGGKSMCG